MKIETTASGKVFLSGEYMALEGGAAIMLSTPQIAKISISDNHQSKNILISSMSDFSYSFKIDEALNFNWLDQDPGNLGDMLVYAVRKLGKKFEAKTITIDTSEFFLNKKKIGIGSSSAVSVAILKALVKLYDINLSNIEVINFAKDIHDKSQGIKGSGFDIITSFLNTDALTCRLINRSKFEYSIVNFPKEINVRVLSFGKPSKTSKMLEKYHIAKKEHSKYFQKISSLMKVELDLLTKSIHLSDIDSIFFHLEKYNTHLINMDNTFNLGIYSKEHKDLMNFANSQGVFYKSSGAGSGDIGILLSKDKSKINNFCDHLSGMNIHFFDL